jgi:hypothetical protein
MKRITLLTLLVFAVIDSSAAMAETDCPPGKHLGSIATKFGRQCYPNSAGPAAAAATCVRHRVCNDGHCTMVCR